ncbi:SDR family NAD(P)-dependent oxidoreductase [Novosphingobium sp. JCM 18896]|uniref:SDR family NAD(P)-dependent oxidoreductase n=1 Tax=Novosphingobium sp. JCM 18896 TaxID=2989731 RepID=UPI002223500A|nr:SDR family oxidoreductase [Novosphingobium sp. JCM 18896]MCW1428668.1 SDR family oxidoreductase [Novosphingobium sp. JCM 18896]
MIRDQLDFTGRVAIITGGATGIGYATALQLAKLGASVVICSRTVDELEAAAARIAAESGQRCLAVPTDVKNEDAVIALVERTVDEFGRIDVLVNNAGGTRMGPLETIPSKGWDSIFDLNMRSAYVATREVGKHMIAQKSGAIVNISSGAGENGVRGGAHYSAAKAALQMFTRVTAAEWGKHGVRVNCVAAGAIASPRVLDAWQVAGLEPDEMGKAIPLRRTGTPDEMANMIVFFASDAASYITGQTIGVNGGPALGGMPDV